MWRAVQHEHDEFYSPEHVFMLWLSSGNTSYDRENLTLRRMMALFRCGRCGVRSISLTSDDKLCLLTNEVLCDRILSKWPTFGKLVSDWSIPDWPISSWFHFDSVSSSKESIELDPDWLLTSFKGTDLRDSCVVLPVEIDDLVFDPWEIVRVRVGVIFRGPSTSSTLTLSNFEARDDWVDFSDFCDFWEFRDFWEFCDRRGCGDGCEDNCDCERSQDDPPSLKIFEGDWEDDPVLRICSLEEIGDSGFIGWWEEYCDWLLDVGKTFRDSDRLTGLMNFVLGWKMNYVIVYY